ncbi:hypothetical protein [Mycolicibacterium elephantis]
MADGMTALAVLASTVALIVAAVRYKHGALLAVGIGIAIHYTYRSIVLDRELDTPHPAYLFPFGNQELFRYVDVLLVLWITVFLLTTAMVRRRNAANFDITAAFNNMQPKLWPIIGVVVVSTLVLVISKGGFEETLRFVRRSDEGQGGTGIFLAAPSILLVASIVRFVKSAPRSRDQAISVLGMLIASIAFVILGSRTPVIGTVAAFVLAALLTATSKSKISLRATALVTLLAVLVPVLVVGLRTVRDASLTEVRNAGQEINLATAFNATYYDALALVVRDSGERFDDITPAIFVDQSFGIVPRALWEGKPQYVSIGKWLRRQYEPAMINGWPPGPPGDWYLALGVVGLVIGAVISAVAANMLDVLGQKIGSSDRPRIAFALTVFWGFVVLPGGVDSEIVMRTFMWIVFPIIYLWLFSRPRAQLQLEAQRRW